MESKASETKSRCHHLICIYLKSKISLNRNKKKYNVCSQQEAFCFFSPVSKADQNSHKIRLWRIYPPEFPRMKVPQFHITFLIFVYTFFLLFDFQLPLTVLQRERIRHLSILPLAMMRVAPSESCIKLALISTVGIIRGGHHCKLLQNWVSRRYTLSFHYNMTHDL